MILLKGSSFTYTPESKSFTKQRSFYFALFFGFLFSLEDQFANTMFLFIQGNFFALVICKEIIAQRPLSKTPLSCRYG